MDVKAEAMAVDGAVERVEAAAAAVSAADVGAVRQIYDAALMNTALPAAPVLAIVAKNILTGAVEEKVYASLELSDGERVITGMVPIEQMELADSADCVPGALIRLDAYVPFNEASGTVVIALGAFVVVGHAAVAAPATAVVAKTAVAAPSVVEEADKENSAMQVTAATAAPAAAAAVSAPAAAGSPVVDHHQAPAPQTPTTAQAPAPTAAATVSPPSTDVLPISDLNPYRIRWSIKARVSNKSDLRAYKNARNEGFIFSVDFSDDSGEIRATAFNEHAQRLFPLLEKGKVYIVSRGNVRVVANPRFNQVRNSYEITFDAHTSITLCAEEAGVVPATFYRFVTVAQIAEMQKDRIIDVIGVLKESGELGSVTSKTTQAKVPKRDIVLYDDTNKEVRMTLWNATAETFAGVADDIVAVKNAKVSEYNGRTLSTLQTSSVEINPDLPEAARLRKWRQGDGASVVTTTLSAASPSGPTTDSDLRKEIGRLEFDKVGYGEKPDYINIRGTVMFVPKEKATYYAAAPDTGNKVVLSGSKWVCDKTKKTYDTCEYRYILRANVVDFSGNTWVNAFNDTAVMIMGVPASEVAALKEANKEDAFAAAYLNTTFKSFVFRMRSKAETYQDDVRVRHNVVGIKPIDFAHESKAILRDILTYSL